MAGADLTTLFKHEKFLEKKGLHAARGMLLAAGYSVVLDAGAAISSWVGGHAALPEMRGS